MNATKELIDFVQNHYNDDASQTRSLLKQFRSEMGDLFLYTRFLPNNAKVKQRMWHVLQNQDTIPKCLRCNEHAQWSAENKRYKNFCSSKCLSASRQFRQSILEQAMLQKYGVDNYAKVPERQTKIRNTCLKKYGVTHTSQRKEYREQFIKTSLARYGTKHPFQNKQVQKKQHVTLLNKYGVKSSKHIHIEPETLAKINNKQWLMNQHQAHKKSMLEIACDLNVSPSAIQKRFNKFSIPVELFYESKEQKQIVIFLKSLTTEPLTTNTRKVIHPYELDIFFPRLNIAIEYNGLYRHSELCGINNTYHLNKTRLCEQQGIRLIQIFENEWVEQQKIVKSRLAYILNQVANKIYARQCVVRQVNQINTRHFNNANHIQGHCSSSINYGLYYNGNLVALMTFGKARFNTQCQYELLRYSNILNTAVIGGAGKLYKHFIKTYKPQSVISYSDKRWNTGNLYRQLGFEFLHQSAPNYFYFNYNEGLILHSRIQFQKHKLQNNLQVFDPNLTEWQNMVTNKYNRIWDCGNDVWVWRK